MDTNVSDIKTLEKSLKDYEAQMAQVKLAILAASSVTEKEELESLQSSLEQLIELTKETVSKLHSSSSNSSEETMLVDKFDDEYALFKAELEAFNNSNEKPTEKDEQKPEHSRSVGEFLNSKHFLDDLNSLKGMKCQAPHSNSYDGISYHNAIICDVNVYDIVQSIDQIQVRVLFVNPTHRDMLPCPKYFEGTCQYLDYACWYSHGEIVQFSDLKEHREPNFDSVYQGCKALVKDIDELWHHATVENNCGDNKWEVRFLTNGKTKVVDLQHILPLGSPDDVDESSSDSEDSSEYEEPGRQVVNDLSALVNKYSMNNLPLSVPTGKKFHSKSMDSRHMAKIGNHSATGPGKFWDGMMEPIESAVYPREKTLGNHDGVVETSGSESSSEDEEPGPTAVRDVSALVNKSLMNKPLSSALGKWECHTKGIGSRLMAKMGYVTGTGLGKYGDGRLEPVEAVVLPVGKSLDHCMNLKEQAGGNLNVSRPNRKLKHLKKSFELKRLKVHNEKKQNVFDFLNKNLGPDKGKLLPHNQSTVSKRNAIPLKSQTNQNLKVEGFRISESIRRTEREMEKIQESLSRHMGDSPTHSNLLKKFKDTQKELDKLKSSASAIDTECNKRKDCEKLSVF